MSFFRNLFGPPDVARLKSRRDFEGLLNALSYPDDIQVRKQAARALGELGDESALTYLISALDDENYAVRENVVKALARLKAAGSLTALIATARGDPSYTVRQAAINAVSQITDPKSARLHAATLGVENEQLAAASELALDQMGRKAVPALMDELGHPDGAVRVKIINLLAKSGDRRAVEPLINRMGADSLATARQRAARALIETGDPHLKPAFIEALNDPSAVVRKEAVRFLGGTGEEGVADVLLPCLEDDSVSVQQAVLVALAKLKDPASIQSIARLAGTAADELRQKAFKLLDDFGSDALEALLTLLDSEETQVRQLAVNSLGALEDERIVLPLVSVLADDSSSVRRGAAQALSKLGWEPPADLVGAQYWNALGKWEQCAAVGPEAAELLFASFKTAGRLDQQKIAIELGRQGDFRAVPALIDMLAAAKKQQSQASEDWTAHVSSTSGEDILFRYMMDDSPGHSTYRMEEQERYDRGSEIEQRSNRIQREIDALVKTLKEISGEDIGDHPEQWRQWWRAKQTGLTQIAEGQHSFHDQVMNMVNDYVIQVRKQQEHANRETGTKSTDQDEKQIP